MGGKNSRYVDTFGITQHTKYLISTSWSRLEAEVDFPHEVFLSLLRQRPSDCSYFSFLRPGDDPQRSPALLKLTLRMKEQLSELVRYMYNPDMFLQVVKKTAAHHARHDIKTSTYSNFVTLFLKALQKRRCNEEEVDAWHVALTVFIGLIWESVYDYYERKEARTERVSYHQDSQLGGSRSSVYNKIDHRHSQVNYYNLQYLTNIKNAEAIRKRSQLKITPKESEEDNISKLFIMGSSEDLSGERQHMFARLKQFHNAQTFEMKRNYSVSTRMSGMAGSTKTIAPEQSTITTSLLSTPIFSRFVLPSLDQPFRKSSPNSPTTPRRSVPSPAGSKRPSTDPPTRRRTTVQLSEPLGVSIDSNARGQRLSRLTGSSTNMSGPRRATICVTDVVPQIMLSKTTSHPPDFQKSSCEHKETVQKVSVIANASSQEFQESLAMRWKRDSIGRHSSTERAGTSAASERRGTIFPGKFGRSIINEYLFNKSFEVDDLFKDSESPSNSKSNSKFDARTSWKPRYSDNQK